MQQTLPPYRFSEALRLGFINYAKCTGRSRRSEFFNFLIGVFLVQMFLFIIFSFGSSNPNEDEFFIICIPIIYFIVTIGPIISVTIRRLHDIGYSGAYLLYVMIPLFGFCYLLYLCSIDSEMRVNEYGPSPKYVIPTTNVNNYNPPVGVIAVTPVVVQPAVIAVPLQPNPPVQPPIAPYPQPNPMVPPPMAPYPQQDPMVPPPMAPYPQQAPMVPNPMYSQQNPMVSPSVPSQAPPDNPYAQPNPLQPGPNY